MGLISVIIPKDLAIGKCGEHSRDKRSVILGAARANGARQAAYDTKSGHYLWEKRKRAKEKDEEEIDFKLVPLKIVYSNKLVPDFYWSLPVWP